MTTSTASKLSKPKSFVKEAEGLTYKHAINNYIGTPESDRTFSGRTFSKDFKTSNTRVSIWALSRVLAAEKAMRCGIRLLENLENDEEARWRVAAPRRARRMNDMSAPFTSCPESELACCDRVESRVGHFSLRSELTREYRRGDCRGSYAVCVTVAVTQSAVALLDARQGSETRIAHTPLILISFSFVGQLQ